MDNYATAGAIGAGSQRTQAPPAPRQPTEMEKLTDQIGVVARKFARLNADLAARIDGFHQNPSALTTASVGEKPAEPQPGTRSALFSYADRMSAEVDRLESLVDLLSAIL